MFTPRRRRPQASPRRRRTFDARLSLRIAAHLRALPPGCDPVDVIASVLDVFPDLSLHDYLGGLVLHCADRAPGYALLVPEVLQ